MTEYSYMCLMFYAALYVEMAFIKFVPRVVSWYSWLHVWYRGEVSSTCGIVVVFIPREVSW